MRHKAKILIVDDKPNNLIALETTFMSIDVKCVKANSGNDALKEILKFDFALAILDVQMPEMDGYELALLIRSREQTKHLPIIFLSAVYSDDFHIFKGYDSGAVDFIIKPFEPKILVNKVSVFLELYHQRKELQDANTFIIEQNKLLQDRASRDGLTRLYNHAHFQNLFKREFELAKRHSHPLTVLMCDLDYFKDVNDTYGHQVGDVVLQKFAILLQKLTRDTDLLARYGGEEFIVALPHTDLTDGEEVGEKIRTTVESHIFQYDKKSLRITVSVGVASLWKGHELPMELIELADSALYNAKASGRNQVISSRFSDVYNGIQADTMSFDQMRAELIKTLTKNKSAALASFEALVHNNLKESNTLRLRNEKAIKLINMFGKHLNLPQKIMLSFRRSLKLHDLFRLYVRDPSFDNDQPLSHDEQQAIFNQPFLMKELTDLFDLFTNERQILLYHHENYNGNGYPKGLKGDEIPFGARIFTLVDAIIAMILPTYPRPSVTGDKLIAELQEQSGKQFDPQLVSLAIDILENEEL